MMGRRKRDMERARKRAFIEEAWRKYGTVRMAPIDPQEYGPLPGLEGPFQFRSGRILYYDPKAGRYYDRKTDMYLSRDEDPSTTYGNPSRQGVEEVVNYGTGRRAKASARGSGWRVVFSRKARDGGHQSFSRDFSTNRAAAAAMTKWVKLRRNRGQGRTWHPDTDPTERGTEPFDPPLGYTVSRAKGGGYKITVTRRSGQKEVVGRGYKSRMDADRAAARQQMKAARRVLKYKRNPEVWRNILDQMGGIGRIRAMIGAKNFASYKAKGESRYGEGLGGVSFRFPRPGRGKPNYVKIILNGKDLYDITFGSVHGHKFKVTGEYKDVYASDLKPLFVRETGLYLTFRNRRR